MTDLTPERLAVLKSLEKAATHGPWCRASGPHRLSESGLPLPPDMLCDDGDVCVRERPYRPVFKRAGLRREEDTRLIATLRNAAPALIKAAEERDELREMHASHAEGYAAAVECVEQQAEQLVAMRAILVEAGEAMEKALDQFRVVKTFLSYANQDVVSSAVAQGNKNMAWHEAVKGAENAEYTLAKIRRATQAEEPSTEIERLDRLAALSADSPT